MTRDRKWIPCFMSLSTYMKSLIAIFHLFDLVSCTSFNHTVNMKTYSHFYKFLLLILLSERALCQADGPTDYDEEELKSSTTPQPTVKEPVTENRPGFLPGATQLPSSIDNNGLLKTCVATDEVINYSRRQLKFLIVTAFNSCPKAKTIDLSHNELTSLSEDIFKVTIDLETLNLSHNILSSVNPKWFASFWAKLKHLDLSSNRLLDFPVGELPKMPSLEKLYLSYNSITDLEEKEFVKKFGNVTIFEANYNPIECARWRMIVNAFKPLKFEIISTLKNITCIEDVKWVQLKMVVKKRVTSHAMRVTSHDIVVYGLVTVIAIGIMQLM